MGMRTDQHMGLPVEAFRFLQENIEPPRVCQHCHQIIAAESKNEKIGAYEGMFGDKYPLSRYRLKDGRTADEFVQASPWSSGPVFFLGLRVSDGTEFRWSDEEIERNT